MDENKISDESVIIVTSTGDDIFIRSNEPEIITIDLSEALKKQSIAFIEWCVANRKSEMERFDISYEQLYEEFCNSNP